MIAIVSHFTKPSMRVLVSLYVKEFLDVNEMVFDDWVPKSMTEKTVRHQD